MVALLRALWFRFTARFRRDALDGDMADELRLHREFLEDEMRRLGTTGDEALRQASIRLGNGTAIRERARDGWSWGMLDTASRDLRYAGRYLRRSPGFTTVALLSIALGVGANAAVFTLVDRLFFRPPAGVPAPDELRRVYVHAANPDDPPFVMGVLAWEMYLSFDTIPALGQVAGYEYPSQVKTGPEWDAPTLRRSLATWRYFTVVGVRPALGRLFVQGDEADGAPLVTVLSHAYWQREYAGDSGVLGTVIPMGRLRAEVVGVAEAGFNGLDLDPADAWLPAATAYTLSLGSTAWKRGRNTMGVNTIMRPGSRATESLLADALSRTLNALPSDPNWKNTTFRAELGSIIRARGPAWHDAGIDVAWRLAGAAVLVLLAACANVGGLLLARGLARERELAVRLAMGVSRRRLLGQLLAESLLLCGLGAVVALAMAQLGGRLLRALILPGISWSGSPVDLRIVLATLLVTVAVGVVGTVFPAWRASRTDPGHALKTGTRGTAGGSRLRGTLITIQLAFSLLLLVGACLFLRSLREATRFDVGFDALSTVTVSMGFIGGSPAPAEFSARLDEAMARLRTVPGVRDIARTEGLPYYSINFASLAIPERDVSKDLRGRNVFLFPVTPAAMRTYGIRPVKGRLLDDGDIAGAPPVVVVSEGLARLLWPGEEPIGKRLRVGEDSMPYREVVGITKDLSTYEMTKEEAQFFVTPDVAGYGANSLVLHVEGDANAVAARVRSSLASWRSDLSSLRVVALGTELADQMRPWRVGAIVFLTFGGIALALAAIGVFGLISFAVTRRTAEFGIRSALGASRPAIARLVLGTTAHFAIAGLAIGVVVSLAAARWLRDLLFHVPPRDAVSIAVACVVLLLTTLVAALHPMWRAMRADPVSALRSE